MFTVAMPTTSASMCDQHVQEEVRFHCINCNITICDDCITGPHKNHNFMKLKDFGTQKRNSLSKYLSAAKESKIPEIRAAVLKAERGKIIFWKSIEQQIILIN